MRLLRLAIPAVVAGALAVPLTAVPGAVLATSALHASAGFECDAALWFGPNGWGHYASSCGAIEPDHQQWANARLWRKSTQKFSQRQGWPVDHDGLPSRTSWRSYRFVVISTWVTVEEK